MNSQPQLEIAPRSFDLISLMHMFSLINLINVIAPILVIIVLRMQACMYPLISQRGTISWVKVFRIIPEFRILRLTFHIASKS